MLVALAHPSTGGERGGLGDFEHLDDTCAAHELSLARTTMRASPEYPAFRPARAGPRSGHRVRPPTAATGRTPHRSRTAARPRAPGRATESTRNALPASLSRNARTTSAFSLSATVQVEYTTKPPRRTRRAASPSSRDPRAGQRSRCRRAAHATASRDGGAASRDRSTARRPGPHRPSRRQARPAIAEKSVASPTRIRTPGTP